MSTLKVFKAHLPSINYIFTNGKPAIFVQGVYRTDSEWEILELEREIKLGHPHLYIDPLETEVDSEMIDPMNALRHKIIAEYKAEEAAKAGNPDRDMGTSDTQALKPGSTRDIAEAASGGSGVQSAARLVNLLTPKTQV